MLVHLNTCCIAFHRDFALCLLGDRLCHDLKGLSFVPVWTFIPSLCVVTLPPHATANTEQHRKTTASWARFGRGTAQQTQGRSHHFDPCWQHQPVLFCHSIKYLLRLLANRFSSQSRSLKMFTPGCCWTRNGRIWNVYAGGKIRWCTARCPVLTITNPNSGASRLLFSLWSNLEMLTGTFIIFWLHFKTFCLYFSMECCKGITMHNSLDQK